MAIKKNKSAAHRFKSVSPLSPPEPPIPQAPEEQVNYNPVAQMPGQHTMPENHIPTIETPQANVEQQESDSAPKKEVWKERAKKRKESIQKLIAKDEIIEADMEAHKDAAEYQNVLDVEAEMKAHRASKRSAFRGRLMRGVQIFFILLCIYMVFLICGVLVTQYEYDPLTGEIRAQRLTIEELTEAGEFRNLQSFYIRARNIYEDVLTLDFRLANNPDRALLIASEYETLLDGVSRLAIDINAANFSPQYNQIVRLLMQWVQTDIAVYIQNISTAVATSDNERAINALLSREVVYNNFLLITETLEVFGQNIRGVQLGDIYEWSPERILAELGGMVYE
jgi:hypothetical protein